MKGSILIVAGENSGEKYGAHLIHEFKKLRPSISFYGIGGKQMEKEGVDLLYSIQELGLVGGFEIITHFPHLKKIFNHLKKEINLKKTMASVLIDSPDFNLRLAKHLKKLSIPVLYYVSPTIWAWRKKRLKTIKKTVYKMLLIFPFEEKIYKEWKIPAEYIGHPLKERLKLSLTKREFYEKYNLDPAQKIITLMPGSRINELKFHMAVLLKAISKIKTEFNAQFLLLLAENLEPDLLYNYIPNPVEGLKILSKNKYEAMAYSHLILASCGTSNLEAAFLEVPLISFYRILPLTYFLGKKLVKIKKYSIVNILAGKRVIPELIQQDFTAENIFHKTKKILDSDEVKSEMIKNFKLIKNIMGERQTSLKAALELEKIISG